MNIYIDRIAVWQEIPTNGLSVRANAPGMVYYDRQNVAQISDSVLVRYAKNYEIKKGKKKLAFSLFILTADQDQIAIEKKLDDTATEFKFEYVQLALEEASLSDFVWSDKYYERSL